MKIEKLRGTRDFDAGTMELRRNIEKKMRGLFERSGFEEIQTPTMEPLELFLLKSGETVINEIYNFKDKGNRDVCLVPERTAPTIRFYVSQLQRRERPAKLYYFENCFRYENPQRARYREFWQIGAEVIGMNDRARTNAELIALAQKALEEVGLKTKVRIGNLDILNGALSQITNEEGKKGVLMRAIDKNDIGFLKENIKDENFFSLLKCRKVEDIEGFDEEKELLEKIVKYLTFYGVEAQLDLSIARGLDYYYGIVFEIDCESLGAEKQIAGGGEYKLLELFGGKEVGSSGFAMGFDRVMDVVTREEKAERSGVLVIPLSENNYTYCLDVLKDLRDNGMKGAIEIYDRTLEKSLKYANLRKIKFAVIIGNKEMEKNSVTIKNLVNGEQKEVKKEKIIENLS